MTITRERLTPAPPQGTYLGMPAFPKAAKGALQNQQLRKNLRHATTVIRSKRAIRASEGEQLGGTAGSPASRSRTALGGIWTSISSKRRRP